MQLQAVDWVILGAFFLVTLLVGVYATRRASRSSAEYFLSGRSMPWWLLGFSMVATTFSTDTPNLVTDIVRKNGVAGNWVWWAFLLTGMLTVFVYARLWRRSGVLTDLEFYELRYSGREAAFLRGFRALYLGVFFNVMIMASVSLAAIKISGVLLGVGPVPTVLIASGVTVVFTSLGGLLGVLLTDFVLFLAAMTGSVYAAVVAVNHAQVGGLGALLAHPAVQGRLAILPEFQRDGAFAGDVVIPLLIVPLAVQWWSVWYPGAEPGGGGYIAQRMLAAKDERHALGATLFFNFCHYALRPWPWILVALASLVVFPSHDSIRAAFPHVDPAIVNDDLAYPAMLTFLPAGALGFVVASLAAAYMSTISTHLNWGSSYVANDFWKRFVRPQAGERELVQIGRIATVAMMAVSALLALLLKSALDTFQILLQIGAGTGLLFVLRWFWWRINAWSEITAMGVSFVIALATEARLWSALAPGWAETLRGVPDWLRLCGGVALTTLAWVTVTLLTRPCAEATLRRFCQLTRPGGPGWASVRARAQADGVQLEVPGAAWPVPMGVACMLVGCVAVYGILFGLGEWLYGNTVPALVLGTVGGGAALLLLRMVRRVGLL